MAALIEGRIVQVQHLPHVCPNSAEPDQIVTNRPGAIEKM
jgi:hypothetical protein